VGVKDIGKPERICLIALALVVLVYLYWYGTGRRLREANTDMARVDQGAYLHDAVKMYEVLHEGREFRSMGAQGPLYPLLLSLAYTPDLTEEEYFERGKYVDVVLSLIILGCLFFVFKRHLPLLQSINLILVTSFAVYMFIAAAFHAEPLFYFLSFCTFLLLCTMLIKPSWKLGVLTGFVAGVTYLVKPSLLPALGLFTLFSVAKIGGTLLAWLIKKPRTSFPFSRRDLAWRLLSIALVGIVFLGTVYPYLRSNKKVFGKPFYCVSTTFYMWYDSWEEVKQGTKAHGDRKGWPDMPSDQIPSLGKYLREHTVQQIVYRMLNGFRILHQVAASSYGYYKYVAINLVILIVLAILNGRRSIEMVAKYPYLLLFCLAYFAAYLFAYAWYTPIASGNRFTLALFLPWMFATSYAIHTLPATCLPIRHFEVKLRDVLNVLVLLIFSFDVYAMLTERLLMM
jgi:hypothetical protein